MRRSRMMLWLAVVVGLGLLLVSLSLLIGRPVLLGAAPLAQASEVEPNNYFDQANSLGMPGTVSGQAQNQPITDTDFFSAPTTAGLNYRATLSIGGAGDLLLKIVVYDHTWSYLTSSSSSNSSS
ncbi:MAG TPA: hypothetical protein EYP77_07065, partial [Anaerolineae bacterium]|nr:hypothetical protein [Anaerolineae bacterium]